RVRDRQIVRNFDRQRDPRDIALQRLKRPSQVDAIAVMKTSDHRSDLAQQLPCREERLLESHLQRLAGKMQHTLQRKTQCNQVMTNHIVKFTRDSDALSRLAALPQQLSRRDQLSIDSCLLLARLSLAARHRSSDDGEHLEAKQCTRCAPSPAKVIVRFLKEDPQA